MGDITKELQLLGITVEDTEGTFKEPVDADYIETLEDGSTITKSREMKERNLLTGDRLRQDFRLSTKDVEVEIPVELKAGTVEGAAPSFQKLFESFGYKNRGLIAEVVTEISHTASKIYIDNADVSKFKVSDVILIKEAGAFHVSPVTAIGTDGGGDFLTLLIPCAAAPSNGVVIAKSQVLAIDPTQNKTLSLRKIHEGGQVTEKAWGLRTQTIQWQNLTVGEYPSLVFGLLGLEWEDKLEVSPMDITTAYDNSQPPLCLEMCIYKNGEKFTITEFSLAMEQTVSIKKSTCAKNGKVSSRGTGKYQITGSFNPYKEQDNIEFTLDESEFSIFLKIHNPAATAGEIKEVISVYLPRVKASAVEIADVDGIFADQVEFKLVPNSESEGPIVFFS